MSKLPDPFKPKEIPSKPGPLEPPPRTHAPAFPVPLGPDISSEAKLRKQGLTLREYFAAAALQGLLSNPETGGGQSDYARTAVDLADELLKELEWER